MKKYKHKLIAKDVEIKFGEHDIKVDLYVNEEGNIRIAMDYELQMKLAPDGTCIEGWNTDVIFYPYEGTTLTEQNEDIVEEIFLQLKKAYQKSEVTSGEFYHQYRKISVEYTESNVRKGIQRFLDWDAEDDEIEQIKFTLTKGKKNWIIKDI